MTYFFLSYARLNAEGKADAYVEKFFKDLVFEIRQKSQPPVQGEIGFRDTSNIAVGDSWPDDLVEALGTCRVFVPLYSPAYFTRPDCGKEWQAFQSRLRDFAAASGAPDDTPPLILPINWVPVDMNKYNLPESITNIQFTQQGMGDTYVREGLLHVIQMNLTNEYQQFVTEFGRRLREVVGQHPAFNASDISPYAQLRNAFEAPAPAGAGEHTGAGVDGPGHVEFIIVAARSGQLGQFPQRQPCYGETPVHWRPYHPQFAKRIGPFAQLVASEADFTSTFIDFGPGLRAKLRQAQKKRNIVVLIIDPWSLHVRDFSEHLHEYDELDLWNCAALISWNDEDPETERNRDALKRLLAEVFENKVAARNPRAFRDSINSLGKLETDLREALCQIHQMIVERAQVARKAEGEKEIALSQVSGPGGGSQ